MITRKEVAQLAGVSEATVSHVVNQSKSVSPELTERVRDVIRKTKYHPNKIAQSLATKTAKHVAIITDDIRNPYFSEIAEGMSEIASKEGYIVSLIGLNYATEEMLRDLIFRNVDGIFSTVISGKLQCLFKEYRDAGIALVGVEGCTIKLDYSKSIEHMVKYLVDLGHRRIAFLSGLPIDNGDSRYKLYNRALRIYKIQPDKLLTVDGNYPYQTEYQDGYRAMKTLIKRQTGATAVFTTNDMMALGAIRAAKEAGMSIPDDISIVGCDDIFFANYVEPPLSTICAPKREIGRRAMYSLLDQIHGRQAENVVLGTEFIVRSSTGPAKK